MLDKIKLDRQKVYCKYCGKEMTAENEPDFYLLPCNEPKVEICCTDCLQYVTDTMKLIVSVSNQRKFFKMFNIGGNLINGIDCPYVDVGSGTIPEELDRLEYEYQEKIIEHATRDRSRIGDWGDDDGTEKR